MRSARDACVGHRVSVERDPALRKEGYRFYACHKPSMMSYKEQRLEDDAGDLSGSSFVIEEESL